MNIQAFAPYRSGNNRRPRGHGFVDLQAGTSANAQWHDGHRRIPQIGTRVVHGPGDMNVPVVRGESADSCGWIAAGYRQRTIWTPLPYERKNARHEPVHAVDIRPPVH